MNKDMQQVPKEHLKHLIKTKSRTEISKELKVPLRTLSRYIKKYGLADIRSIRFPSNLTKEQANIIDGTLLGDSHLRKISGRAKNSRFSIKQTLCRESYVKFIFNKLSPFSQKIYNGKCLKPNLIKGEIKRCGNEYCYSAMLQTCCHPIFTNLRNRWYFNDVKIVPKDLILNDTILAHWAMCDGYNNMSKKNYTMCTDSFSKDDIQFLVDSLYKTYNIKSNITKNNRIYIGAREYFNFIEIISPFITLDCMKNKIDTSKVAKTKKNWGANKLSMEKAKDIRRLYHLENYTQKQLAELFKVSCSTINKIVNNISYKEPTMAAFKGNAIIKVKFNHDNIQKKRGNIQIKRS